MSQKQAERRAGEGWRSRGAEEAQGQDAASYLPTTTTTAGRLHTQPPDNRSFPTHRKSSTIEAPLSVFFLSLQHWTLVPSFRLCGSGLVLITRRLERHVCVHAGLQRLATRASFTFLSWWKFSTARWKFCAVVCGFAR